MTLYWAKESYRRSPRWGKISVFVFFDHFRIL